MTNRQNMLAKLYGDGDLAGREDAYKAAVEQYGADSVQARKAATQGTMTAIIGVGTALDSMSYSLKKVTNKQLKYDEAVKKFGKNSETALDALADLQSEQYSFVGFAENLADAFELDDSGKRMMMQLGYSGGLQQRLGTGAEERPGNGLEAQQSLWRGYPGRRDRSDHRPLWHHYRPCER